MQEKRCRTRQKSKDQILSQKKKQNKKVHCKNVEQEELNTNTGKIICIDILSLTAEQKAQNAEDFCGSNVSFFLLLLFYLTVCHQAYSPTQSSFNRTYNEPQFKNSR